MGFILVIVSSLVFPIVDVLKKKATKSYGVKVIFWGIATFSLPFYFFYLLYRGIPEIDPYFWLIIAIDVPLLIYTSILLIKDEKIAPISTTLPLLSFTPVFLILTSHLFLGELPNVYGVIGIILVVIGAVLLKGEEVRKGLLKRIRHIFSSRASVYILIIAFIWSFNANFAKMAMMRSSVEYYLFIITLIEAVVMNVWLFTKHRHDLKKVTKGHHLLLISAAAITAIASIAFLNGMETIFVSYAIVIKRAGLIIGSIVFGAVVFKEKNIKYRIAGATVMLFGIIFILVLH